MYFVVLNGKPYAVIAGQVYACLLTANELKIDYDNRLKKAIANKVRYSLPEVRRYFGLKMVEKYGTKGKVSNGSVSSLSEKKK